jgi:hypothetical protein
VSGHSSFDAGRVDARFYVKIAAEPWEFDAIHRLNYQTFVDEIPQHRPDPSGRLIDKFHGENTYIICISGTRLLGMIAVRGRRPFSLDLKLPDFESYLPPGRRVCWPSSDDSAPAPCSNDCLAASGCTVSSRAINSR